MNRVNAILVRHLKDLSHICVLDMADDLSYFIVYGIRLPVGYSIYDTPISTLSSLIEIPANYPIEPPGVGDNKIFLPKGLRYNGKKIKHYHPCYNLWGEWIWYCWHEINWDPRRDDLIMVVELLRTNLCSPSGRK